MATSVIDAAMCERFVNAAAQKCVVAQIPPAPSDATAPPWDAIATSLSLVGAGVTWGGTVLAIVALVAGIAWAKLVRGQAREEARKCAEEIMDKWLAEEAPQLLSKMNATLQDASLGELNDQQAADDIGKGAG